MKLLFDQNISPRILNHLPEYFTLLSVTVKGLGIINASDYEIWNYAKANDYIIITQDSDFNDLLSLFGFPPKIVWLRTGNLKTKDAADILIRYWEEIQRFSVAKDYGCFEIFKLR